MNGYSIAARPEDVNRNGSSPGTGDGIDEATWFENIQRQRPATEAAEFAFFEALRRSENADAGTSGGLGR